MVQCVQLANSDPWIHLAQEEAFFNALPADSVALVLYVNRPCVVMGKHQNPLREVRFEELQRRGWPLLRRFSGGGTVFHDEGNLNYSFLVTRTGVTKESVLSMVVEALRTIGVVLTLSPQGDLHRDGRKVSGTASQVRRDRWMVHGTLLCQADLEGLHGVLGPTGDLVEWVGVSSRPQPVANLGITVEAAATALRTHLERLWGKGDAVWDEQRTAVDPGAVDRLEATLRSREWTWDRTPKFRWSGATRQGPLDVTVEDGQIRSVHRPEPGDETENLSRMVGMTFFSSALFDLFA